MYELNENGEVYIRELGTFIPRTTIDQQNLDNDIKHFKNVIRYITSLFLFTFIIFLVGMLFEIIIRINDISYFVGIRIIGILGLLCGIFEMLYHIGTIIYLCVKHNFLWIANKQIKSLFDTICTKEKF